MGLKSKKSDAVYELTDSGCQESYSFKNKIIPRFYHPFLRRKNIKQNIISNWNNIMSYLLINRKLFYLHVCTSIKFSFFIPFISNIPSLRIHYAFN